MFHDTGVSVPDWNAVVSPNEDQASPWRTHVEVGLAELEAATVLQVASLQTPRITASGPEPDV